MKTDKYGLYRFASDEQEMLISCTDEDVYWGVINNEITVSDAMTIMNDIYGVSLSDLGEEVDHSPKIITLAIAQGW